MLGLMRVGTHHRNMDQLKERILDALAKETASALDRAEEVRRRDVREAIEIGATQNAALLAKVIGLENELAETRGRLVHCRCGTLPEETSS